MNIEQKFFLYSHIYYTTNSWNHLLLYNTKTGTSIESDSGICRELIEEVYKPVNLGVIDLTDNYLNHPEAVDLGVRQNSISCSILVIRD